MPIAVSCCHDERAGAGQRHPRPGLPDCRPHTRIAGVDPGRCPALAVGVSGSWPPSCWSAWSYAEHPRSSGSASGARGLCRRRSQSPSASSSTDAAPAQRLRCLPSCSSTSSATTWPRRWRRRFTSTWDSPRRRSASSPRTPRCWPSIIGGLLGGLLIVKIGINRGLWLFGVVQLATILGFVWLSQMAGNLWVLRHRHRSRVPGGGSGHRGVGSVHCARNVENGGCHSACSVHGDRGLATGAGIERERSDWSTRSAGPIFSTCAPCWLCRAWCCCTGWRRSTSRRQHPHSRTRGSNGGPRCGGKPALTSGGRPPPARR